MEKVYILNESDFKEFVRFVKMVKIEYDRNMINKIPPVVYTDLMQKMIMLIK